MFGAILRIVNRFVRYFWGIKNFEYNSSNDLQQIAHDEIQIKIRQIEELSRYRDENGNTIFVAQAPVVADGGTTVIRTQGLSYKRYIQQIGTFDADLVVPESEYSITLEENESKRNISVGKITDKYNITVKSGKNSKNFNTELKYLEKLRNCDHFLSLLFTIDDSYKFVMESYCSNLKEYNKEFKPYDAVKQITSGLGFLHNLNIAHSQFNKENIVIVSQPYLRFKIMNFSKAETTNDIKLFHCDIIALGQLIHYIFFTKNNYKKQNLTLYEESLVVDLVTKLCRDDKDIRPLAKLIKHPFFYSTKETLHFLVKVWRILEKDVQLSNYVNERLKKACGNNWHQTLKNYPPGQEVCYALKIYCFPYWSQHPNVWLVGKIRNLVVHKRSIEVQTALNVTNEIEFLHFWTHRFPLLIIELYNSLQSCDT